MRFTSKTSAGSTEEVSEEEEVFAEVDGKEVDGVVAAGEEEDGEVRVGEIESDEGQEAEEASADVEDSEGVTVEALPLPSWKAELICV